MARLSISSTFKLPSGFEMPRLGFGVSVPVFLGVTVHVYDGA
jgi:hypothetical protein